MSIEIPDQGFIFWPVGCGDATTIVVSPETVVQIDIHQEGAADSESDPRVPVLDELVALLPEVDGKPYLAAFGLTHADDDHCQGFKELLETVHIGDLWFTPAVLRVEDELSEDAQAFCDEAKRRVRKNIDDAPVGSGDRIRVIGYSDLLGDDYEGLPDECLTVPGGSFSEIDGTSFEGQFRAFVHAPFKDDAEKERNETSFALQVTLENETAEAKALLLGDLANDGVTRIFEMTPEPENKEWNVFLAPHHCSASVLYTTTEAGNTVKDDELIAAIEDAALDPGWIVSSSGPIPDTDKEGANPPHAKAKVIYQEIAPDGFICTGEHPNTDKPEPVVFDLDSSGLTKRAPEGEEQKRTLDDAVRRASGEVAPQPKVGYGAGR